MATTRTVALVPLRSAGKTRLAPRLDREQRAGLAGAMLADVSRALTASSVDRVVVAASGAAAVAAASALDLEVVRDPVEAHGLDAAIRAAVPRLGRVERLLIVAADLPRLTPEDIAAVLRTDADVIVAPTHDGGTGGLLRKPPDVIATAYGHGSAARHLALAERSGLRAQVVHTPGFATDVDTVEDVATVRGGPLGPATAHWLATANVDLESAS